MWVVLVLGAGASLAHAEHFHGQRMQDRNPPLDVTFFEKVRALQIAVPVILRDYGRRVPPVDPFEKLARSVRMEEFLKDLYYDFLDSPGREQIREAYSELVELYVRVIRETTNWMCEPAKIGGPIGRLIAAAAEDADGVTILTFNHDLVIENEVVKRARLRPRWCIDEGYGSMSEEMEYTDPAPGLGAFYTHGPACDHQRPIHLLKMHGSLNWYIRIGGERPSGRQLSGQGASPQIYASRRRTVPVQFQQHVEREGRGRRTFNTWPVVVPPIYGKDALIKAFVGPVWDDGRLRLANADLIVFFGYSLPEMDIQAERLFQRALRVNREVAVAVVNRSPQAAARFAGLSQGQPVTWYGSIDRFLHVGPFS